MRSAPRTGVFPGSLKPTHTRWKKAKPPSRFRRFSGVWRQYAGGLERRHPCLHDRRGICRVFTGRHPGHGLFSAGQGNFLQIHRRRRGGAGHKIRERFLTEENLRRIERVRTLSELSGLSPAGGSARLYYLQPAGRVCHRRLLERCAASRQSECSRSGTNISTLTE